MPGFAWSSVEILEVRECELEGSYLSQVVEDHPYYQKVRGVGGLTKWPMAVAAIPLDPGLGRHELNPGGG